MHDIFVMQRLNEIAIFYRQNFIPLSFWFDYFFKKKQLLYNTLDINSDAFSRNF